jgi:Protein of unknown function (DUF4058)
MPGPFPGMDPYLELPENWRGVHSQLITMMAQQLNEYLPLPFAAVVEERCYVFQEEREIIPDFGIVRPFDLPQKTTTSTAVLERPQTTPAEVMELEPIEVKQRFINIIAVRDRELITTIELLSPVNKSREGRRKYQRKQSEILKSDVHLIEIDLLRGGEHTVHVPQARLQKRGKAWDYLICLHRAHQRHRVEYWAVPLPQKLPVIAVPLTPEIADVPLDLQSALDTLYDRGAYARILDYDQPLLPALSKESQDWANQVLHQAGAQ